MADYTILVNSTDSFEDCWHPFFHLLEDFWPACDRRIVLNTETKEFHHTGLAVESSRVAIDDSSRFLPWGECLRRCLAKIDSEIILYLQDDYFLYAPVDVARLEQFVEIMNRDGHSCIRLLECPNAGPWVSTENPLLWQVAQDAEYRLSLQAGLWRKERLLSYLRPDESAWEFEVCGSKRARNVRDSILCVNRDMFSARGTEIVPYEATGIVKGKWVRETVEPLFVDHGITVDFAKRGFYTPGSRRRLAGLRSFAGRARRSLRQLARAIAKRDDVAGTGR